MLGFPATLILLLISRRTSAVPSSVFETVTYSRWSFTEHDSVSTLCISAWPSMSTIIIASTKNFSRLYDFTCQTDFFVSLLPVQQISLWLYMIYDYNIFPSMIIDSSTNRSNKSFSFTASININIYINILHCFEGEISKYLFPFKGLESPEWLYAAQRFFYFHKFTCFYYQVRQSPLQTV